MPFEREKYIEEMKQMVDTAIDLIKAEYEDLEIYTVSIWTDPVARHSSINFDTKSNSERCLKETKEWLKINQDITEEDYDKARTFGINETRNCNPADFILSDFGLVKNFSIPKKWVIATEGECWSTLEPALREVGEYAFLKIKTLKTDALFELGVNDRDEWYAFTWQVNS